MARRHKTQVRVVKRCAEALIVLVTAGFALMTFETGRQIGLSLFGMAGIAGLVAAFAAYPVLKNLVAGVQVAMTQPFRIGDIVEVDGQTGKIADVTSSSVVLMRLSDRRRLIVPLSTLTEKPFQNVPREGLGTAVTLSIHTNDTVPVERARQKLTEIVKDDPHWDGRVVHLEVADAKPGIAELRVLASAATPHEAWNLRCAIREKLITFLQREHPGALLGTHRQPNADIGPESPRAPGSINRPGSRHEAGPAAVPSNLPVRVNRPPLSLAEQWRYSASAWTGALFTQARAWSRTFFMQAKAWSRAFFMERSGKHRHSRNSNTGRGVAG